MDGKGAGGGKLTVDYPVYYLISVKLKIIPDKLRHFSCEVVSANKLYLICALIHLVGVACFVGIEYLHLIIAYHVPNLHILHECLRSLIPAGVSVSGQIVALCVIGGHVTAVQRTYP